MVEQLMEILPLVIPLILIDLGFRIYAIIDIIQEDRKVLGNNKIIWVILMAVINFGWAVYFLVGRDE